MKVSSDVAGYRVPDWCLMSSAVQSANGSSWETWTVSPSPKLLKRQRSARTSRQRRTRHEEIDGMKYSPTEALVNAPRIAPSANRVSGTGRNARGTKNRTGPFVLWVPWIMEQGRARGRETAVGLERVYGISKWSDEDN